MKNSNFNPTFSSNVSDTWSRKARSSSPPPTLEVDQSAIVQGGGCATTKKSQNNKRKAQNDVLYGVGSQFPAIDDSTRNKDLHPKL
ncbi:hypothetical protein ACHAQJ_007440 [Trichoderma viride]